MTWPNQFNLCDERTAYVDLEKSEGVPEFLWTEPGAFGDSRRKRMKPKTLTVQWCRNFREPKWEIRSIKVSGTYVHKTAGYRLYVYYRSRLRPSPPEVEPWMEPLIAETHPDVRNP